VVAHFLLALAVVFGINLLPAFGPPTFAVLIFFRFRYGDIPVVGLIIGGSARGGDGPFPACACV
jgi:hypothetical protein